ncbi:hypothetical protein [Bacillus sp. EAC]|uniref:hypothetical protein n=1 Tax=Bacillus sp. EAC TaxID=1978338 RepID=UPI001155246A|nr:hypothetical protein [Bacillus sp. EAC]
MTKTLKQHNNTHLLPSVYVIETTVICRFFVFRFNKSIQTINEEALPISSFYDVNLVYAILQTLSYQ